MHFDVVLSVFIHPCSKKRRAQFSIRAELTRLSVCVRFRCVCVRALQMCVRAIQMCVCVCVCVCVHARFRYVCVCTCTRAIQMCVCVCVCVCVCARAIQMCASDFHAHNPERLICSPCAFGQSLYRVLTCEFERECTRWW